MQGMKLTDLKSHMKGIMAIQMTPFNSDGSLDLEGMRSNTRWVMERMAARNFEDYFLNPLGSFSEFYSLTEDEIRDVIKMVAEEAKGKVVVMAGGTGKITTRETIKMCQYAQSVGADGAFVILPYFMAVTEEGMYQHYKQVAESVAKDFGIIIYNTLMSGCNWIKPPLMARITKIPNIICIKESTRLIENYVAMRRAVDPKDANILCGSGAGMFILEAAYGCDGYDAYNFNWDPDWDIDLYQAVAAKDFDKAREIVDSTIPLDKFQAKVIANHGPDCAIPGTVVTGGMGAAIPKATMDIVGLRGGEPRLPIVGLNEKEKAELRDVLRAMGLVKSGIF